VRGDADGAEGVGCAVIGTEELGGGGSYGHWGIIVVRFFSQCADVAPGCCEAKVGWSSKTGLFQNGKW
jgi:hypothetical protein